jgi:hypothetical protein
VAKTTLRIRFTFNRESGSPSAAIVPFKKRIYEFAQTVVEDVGTLYAQGEFTALKSFIRGSLEPIIQRELANIADLYDRFIVGKQRIGGTLMTASRGGQPRVGLGSALPPWAPRGEKYLKYKLRDLGHTKWFEYSGYLGRALRKPENWETFFGPIHISIQPIRSQSSKDGSLTDHAPAFSYANVGSSLKMRFGVARISASVFGLVTPAMVSALANGDMSAGLQTQDGRKDGLIGLVFAHDEELAHHLAGRGPYRPTLEPFLAFAITRSIPDAMTRALTKAGFEGGTLYQEAIPVLL